MNTSKHQDSPAIFKCLAKANTLKVGLVQQLFPCHCIGTKLYKLVQVCPSGRCQTLNRLPFSTPGPSQNSFCCSSGTAVLSRTCVAIAALQIANEVQDQVTPKPAVNKFKPATGSLRASCWELHLPRSHAILPLAVP